MVYFATLFNLNGQGISFKILFLFLNFNKTAKQLRFGPQQPTQTNPKAEEKRQNSEQSRIPLLRTPPLCLNSSPVRLPPAGARRAAAEPDGADGEDLGEEQEEAPQGRRKHQEEAVRAGFQHLQRLVQRVRAFVSQHG